MLTYHVSDYLRHSVISTVQSRASLLSFSRSSIQNNQVLFPDQELSWKSSITNVICYSWMNILLVFVPIGIVSSIRQANPSMIFFSNAIAVIPLSSLLTCATESIASDMGDTIGALLNITLGNLVEVIIL